MKKFLLFPLMAATFIFTFGQQTPNDGDWKAQLVELKDTPEADFMIRVGDIDNLGFGWTENFNPFTGRSTDSHEWPFTSQPADAAPTDRILIGSAFNANDVPCQSDGYSGHYNPKPNGTRPTPLVFPLASIKNAVVKSAALIMFVDDFQSPAMCSKFQVKVNGVRFVEMEKMLNALEQTGPIGKIVTVLFTPEMLEMLKGEKLSILIDDPSTRAGDGYAIDFAKLLVNPKPFSYLGGVTGRVIDAETEAPIPGASAEVVGFETAKANQEGEFKLRKVPAGLVVVNASAPGYSSGQASADVVAGEEGEPVTVRLKRSQAVSYTGKKLREGEVVTLSNIQFDQNSANLRPEGQAELDKLAAFMKENPTVEIELSGHTSSEGGADLNRNLSLRRVLSCKKHLMQRGIDEGRITTVGYGPDRPVASNDNEAGRAQNRRVEMKLTKL